MTAESRISRWQSIDGNGVPRPGAKALHFDPGTTTPRTTYSDGDLTVEQPFPLVADANGLFPQTFVQSGVYRLRHTDANGAVIFDDDDLDPGVATGVGAAVPVESGGTGATTAPAARSNLGAASQAEVDGVSNDLAAVTTRFGTTGATEIASGTTAQQPAEGTAGNIRVDTDVGGLFFDTGAAWKQATAKGEILPTDFAPASAVICLQRTKALTTATNSISSAIPADTTIPQITEGAEILSLVVTPKNAASVMSIRVRVTFGTASTDDSTIALFKAGTSNALKTAHIRSVVGVFTLLLEHEEPSGGVAPVTFSVRIGAGTGTITLNEGTSYTFGGTRDSAMYVQEWLTL